MDMVDLIIEYEKGTLDVRSTLELFSRLVKNGYIWILQDSYGKMANQLIEQGILDKEGNILKDRDIEDPYI
jgi:hypothetical protein